MSWAGCDCPRRCKLRERDRVQKEETEREGEERGGGERKEREGRRGEKGERRERRERREGEREERGERGTGTVTSCTTDLSIALFTCGYTHKLQPNVFSTNEVIHGEPPLPPHTAHYPNSDE